MVGSLRAHGGPPVSAVKAALCLRSEQEASMGNAPTRPTTAPVTQQLNLSCNAGITAAGNPDFARRGLQPPRRDEFAVVPSLRRRDFIKLCGTTAALLGLGAAGIPRIADALVKAASQRPSVVWLNFASDTGCTEALIKATYPNAAQIVLDILSLDYNETIMAAAGKQAEEILEGSRKKGGYILVVEGGVPTKKGHGMIAGKEMLDILKDFSSPAIAILAVGSCATFGGVPAAKPNPSQIIGVSEALEI